MVDPFAADTYEGSAASAVAITTSDTVEVAYAYRALYVGTGGDVKVNMLNTGTAITFSNVPEGSVLPIRVRLIYATGTTASNIVGLY